MKSRFILVLLLVLIFCGIANANKQLDSLFYVNSQNFKAELKRYFPDENDEVRFRIIGTYSEKLANKKHNDAYIKGLKKLFKELNTKIRVNDFRMDIPNLNDQLNKHKRLHYGELPNNQYLAIPTLKYLINELQLGLIVYSYKSGEIINFQNFYIDLEQLKSVDRKSWDKSKYKSYIELTDDDYIFSIGDKHGNLKYTSDDTRNFHLPSGKYKIEFKNASGLSQKLELELDRGDSLRIDIVKRHASEKLKRLKHLNIIIPGVGFGLFPKLFSGSADQWVFKVLYLYNTIFFYNHLFQLEGYDFNPNNHKYLSQNAKDIFRNGYYRRYAWAAGHFILNIAFGYLINHLYYDEHLKLEPIITDLNVTHNNNSIGNTNLYGVKLTCGFSL